MSAKGVQKFTHSEEGNEKVFVILNIGKRRGMNLFLSDGGEPKFLAKSKKETKIPSYR